MGNQTSTTSSSPSSSKKNRKSSSGREAAEQAAERAKRVVGDLQEGIKNSVKKLDDDHPAAQLLDSMCGAYFDDESKYKYRHSRSASYYSEDASEDGSRTYRSEDDTTYDERRSDHRKSDKSVESASVTTSSDYESEASRRDRKGTGGGSGRNRRKGHNSFDTEEESKATATSAPDEPNPKATLISKPLASSFAKRCYFTKAGIGKTTQHYEGLTLTGNVVLMLAAAMKLKGCPTICDEDLRRVEQTYPNQFSRLPDELLLSSGWRRISKYCHFSNKPIPDGVPFFHSKQRLHPTGGYYFLLAAAVGMIRPIDVEPLTKDTLVLLETDYPTYCDATPSVLIRDPEQWVLVNKFCFFSGGPINTEEDVYYQADFHGNPIFMLAFLSPSLTPEELYKLAEVGPENEPGLKSVTEVQEVESVYDLTDRDFDDLKLYHLGPCRALPQYILQPSAWTKVLPPHFLAARQQAMLRAQDFEGRLLEETEMALEGQQRPEESAFVPELMAEPYSEPEEHPDVYASDDFVNEPNPALGGEFEREMEEEGAFHGGGTHSFEDDYEVDTPEQAVSPPREASAHMRESFGRDSMESSRLDPPDDEPPSLKKGSVEEAGGTDPHFRSADYSISSPAAGEPSIDDQGFFSVAEAPLEVSASQVMMGTESVSNKYVSPESTSASNHHYFHDDRQRMMPSHDLESPLNSDHPQYAEDEAMYMNDEVAENGDSAYSQRHEFVDRGLGPSSPQERFEHSAGSPITGGSNNKFFDAESSLNGGSNQFSGMVDHRYQTEQPIPTQHTVGHAHDPYDGTEEKKYGVEVEEYDSQLENSSDMVKVGHTFQTGPPPQIDPNVDLSSPQSFESLSQQSPAMRGAHEILKRNRRRRLEVLSNRSSPPKQRPTATTPSEASMDRQSIGTFDDSGSDYTGSAVSGSSVWTDTSGPGDRSSRRALILQMAKARMKNNKEKNPKSKPSSTSPISEGQETMTALSQGPDIDLTGDLD